MASYQYLYIKERTSHLMRFYNLSSGKIHFIFFTLTLAFLHDIIFFVSFTPKFSSSEGRPFRLGTGANMEKVVKMDRDMTKV